LNPFLIKELQLIMIVPISEIFASTILVEQTTFCLPMIASRANQNAFARRHRARAMFRLQQRIARNSAAALPRATPKDSR
jgi:hypothetical protein